MVIQKHLDKLNKLIFKPQVNKSDIQDVIEELETQLLQNGCSTSDTESIIDEIYNKIKPPYQYSPIKSVFNKILYERICRKNKNISNIDSLYKFNFNRKTAVFMIGTLGAGKTTTIMKYAMYYRRRFRLYNMGVICLDTERIGAIDQLQQNCNRVGVSCYYNRTENDNLKILNHAIQMDFHDYKFLVIDTSGIDDSKNTLTKIRKSIEFMKLRDYDIYIFHVIDNTHSGNSIKSTICKISEYGINVNGYIISKMDFPPNLGALIAIDKPLLFIGNGEHACDFHPYSASYTYKQIFGKQIEDIVLNERNYTKKMIKKMQNNKATLADCYKNIKRSMDRMETMGPVMAQAFGSGTFNEILAKVKKFQYIIDSLTTTEKLDTNYLNYLKQDSRLLRIALGSGTNIDDVKALLTGFNGMTTMMKNMADEMNPTNNRQTKQTKQTKQPKQTKHRKNRKNRNNRNKKKCNCQGCAQKAKMQQMFSKFM